MGRRKQHLRKMHQSRVTITTQAGRPFSASTEIDDALANCRAEDRAGRQREAAHDTSTRAGGQVAGFGWAACQWSGSKLTSCSGGTVPNARTAEMRQTGLPAGTTVIDPAVEPGRQSQGARPEAAV
jgi:hypothetical protein